MTHEQCTHWPLGAAKTSLRLFMLKKNIVLYVMLYTILLHLVINNLTLLRGSRSEGELSFYHGSFFL